MARAISLHIGLNRVDPEHYPGVWDLQACEADARSMQNLAEGQGFETHMLLSEAATCKRLKTEIQKISKQLSKGDIFLLSYAGHGGQLPQQEAQHAEERDDLDETWCLYDSQLRDDELYQLWAEFTEGVHIVLISDSCHSGTIARCQYQKYLEGEATEPYEQFRYMPRALGFRVYKEKKQEYDERERLIRLQQGKEMQACLIQIAACRDDQLALEKAGQGVLSRHILGVWQEGAFDGSYRDFFEQLTKAMSQEGIAQVPMLGMLGKEAEKLLARTAFRS